LVPGWWYVISAESFLDRMTEMPDVLELAPMIRSCGPCDVEIVPNCNHFYIGREAEIRELVSGWLVRTLNIGAGV
jgi:hypothetical protein